MKAVAVILVEVVEGSEGRLARRGRIGRGQESAAILSIQVEVRPAGRQRHVDEAIDDVTPSIEIRRRLQQEVGPNNEQVVSNYFSAGNTFHEPDASYDALNQQTLFLYNAYGQITEILWPTGLTTTNAYFGSGPSLNRLASTG